MASIMWLRVSILISAVLLFAPISAVSGSNAITSPQPTAAGDTSEVDMMLDDVGESYDFSGLALYLNNIAVYHWADDALETMTMTKAATITLSGSDYIAVVGRYKVMVIRGRGSEDTLVTLSPNSLRAQGDATFQQYYKNELAAADLQNLRYSHLWWPLAALTRIIDDLLVFIQQSFTLNWGVAIILLSLCIKLILLPLTLWTLRASAKADSIKAALEPQLVLIKRDFDGEEAHERIMDAHRQLNVTPFYSLKPMLITLLQFPFFIAAFNALGEMPQLVGAKFLWISNLAYPDSVYSFSESLPLIGQEASVLPVLMLFVSLLSLLASSPSHSGKNSILHYRSMLLMPLVFLVLFYPFPAAMVLYWTAANFWQLLLEVARKQKT